MTEHPTRSPPGWWPWIGCLLELFSLKIETRLAVFSSVDISCDLLFDTGVDQLKDAGSHNLVDYLENVRW